MQFEVHVPNINKVFRCTPERALYYSEANDDPEKPDVELEIYAVDEKTDKAKKTKLTNAKVADLIAKAEKDEG